MVAETGSLTKVANILKLPKSNVSRRINALEQQLQVALFLRKNRSLSLTRNGDAFYQRTKPLIEQLHQAVDDVMNKKNELAGHLRIQALALPIVDKIQRKIFDFMRLHPKVHVEFLVTDHYKNLVEEHIDIAFWGGENLKDSSLIARRYDTVELGYYASREYLDRYGAPDSYEDLPNHRVIGFRNWHGELVTEYPTTKTGPFINIKPYITVNNVMLMDTIVRSGEAIGVLADSMMDIDIESRREGLIRLFPERSGFTASLWTVYSSRQQLSHVARAFLDYMYDDVELV